MRKVFYDNIFARLLLRGSYKTCMLFGFICTKHKQDAPLSEATTRHESIHVMQYATVSVVAFLLAIALNIAFGGAVWFYFVPLLYYILYFLEAMISVLKHRVRGKKIKEAYGRAYDNSMFEQEAYAHETEPDYIQRRRWFAVLKYFGKI